jgi:hypothetical protein
MIESALVDVLRDAQETSTRVFESQDEGLPLDWIFSVRSVSSGGL